MDDADRVAGICFTRSLAGSAKSLQTQLAIEYLVFVREAFIPFDRGGITYLERA
jgi:hypothetical protein